MTKTPMPTNIDDAFVDGWYFGRYCRAEHHHVMTVYNSTTAIRREYERGVFEGRQFRIDDRHLLDGVSETEA